MGCARNPRIPPDHAQNPRFKHQFVQFPSLLLPSAPLPQVYCFKEEIPSSEAPWATVKGTIGYPLTLLHPPPDIWSPTSTPHLVPAPYPASSTDALRSPGAAWLTGHYGVVPTGPGEPRRSTPSPSLCSILPTHPQFASPIPEASPSILHSSTPTPHLCGNCGSVLDSQLSESIKSSVFFLTPNPSCSIM